MFPAAGIFCQHDSFVPPPADCVSRPGVWGKRISENARHPKNVKNRHYLQKTIDLAVGDYYNAADFVPIVS
jgi:hypothetical protein